MLLLKLILLIFLIEKVWSSSSSKRGGGGGGEGPLLISGVYPHLSLYNPGFGNSSNVTGCDGNGDEGGIGAIVPWANKLWMITYSPHCPTGSSDKLYTLDENLQLEIRPESIGGTPANRLIHRETNQLILSNYFIDNQGHVRTLPLKQMSGRMTATARHLLDPANLVYFYDMEGKIYEVNVNTLDFKLLFTKPIPGWHGKGAYTSQKRIVFANNGEFAIFPINPADLKVGGLPKNEDEMGILATWDGKEEWKLIERKQFTEVTGPGGIEGASDDQSVLWSIGWDRRSVILKLLDNDNWYTYRLPKASHAYDHRGGWYTEWPRIRQIGNDQLFLMDMHAMFYDFPKTFSLSNSSGLRAIGSHLRMIPDFTYWNGQLVLASDETTLMYNPFPGRCYSNLWFGQYEDLKNWGGATGWGGPWANNSVIANQPSDPFFIKHFNKIIIHLVHNLTTQSVTFTLEIDTLANNQWTFYRNLTVDQNGYDYLIFPQDLSVNWIRFTIDKSCNASAYLFLSGSYHSSEIDPIFNSLADANDTSPFNVNLMRPGATNTTLQTVSILGTKLPYLEVDEKLNFFIPQINRTDEVLKILNLTHNIEIDEWSVLVTDFGGSFRLPKGDPAFDQPFDGYWPRGARELETERYMLNAHGSFYEVGREAGLVGMRPIATHNKKIMDFATWRGLLVLTGTKQNAQSDGHYFSSQQGNGLWFGVLDDLWKLGKPRGHGFIWENYSVSINHTSSPYLMTGYDHKTMTIESNVEANVTFEINVDMNGWHTYQTFTIQPQQTFQHIFPDGFNAHWIRAIAKSNAIFTIHLLYE